VNLCPENLIIGYNNKERADLMIVRSSNKCYYCDKEIKWFVTIKGGEIEEIGLK
jgi:thioredoxin-related protein